MLTSQSNIYSAPTIARRLKSLRSEGLALSTRTFKAVLSESEMSQELVDEMSKDPVNNRGPRRIWEALGAKGIPLPR